VVDCWLMDFVLVDFITEGWLSLVDVDYSVSARIRFG